VCCCSGDVGGVDGVACVCVVEQRRCRDACQFAEDKGGLSTARGANCARRG
jgi:hypothetical protein